KSGGKHALTEVVAETMQMLGSRSSKQNVHDDDASDETGIETHDDVAEIVSENEYSEHTVVRTDEVPF
ncbi:MAG TPA: hypothetical protein PKU71_10805, partial [bacterium]|nr:hypothetical protein [bacterium]